MRSATAFLPLTITWLMNLATVWLWYLGSGRISRFATMRRLGMLQSSMASGESRKGPRWRGPGLTGTDFRICRSFGCGDSAYLGRLAPYLERRWRRSDTPEVSRVPRTVW